jgi:hypothetical protein
MTRSIRMHGKTYDVLRKEAATRAISFNTLTNEILDKYVNFDRFMFNFELMVLHKRMLIRQFLELRDETIRSIGEGEGSIFARQILTTTGRPLNKESMVYFVDTVVSRYQDYCRCERHTTGEKERFVLRHDLGAKWTVFLTSYLAAAFKSVLRQDVTLEVGDQKLSFIL